MLRLVSGNPRFPTHILLVAALGLSSLLIGARPGLAQAGRGRVSGVPALNVREGPGTEYKASSWVAEGEQVEIEETSGSWVRIRTRVGDAGWVNIVYLDLGTPTAGQADAPATPSPGTPQAAETPVSLEAALTRNAELAGQVAALEEQLAVLREQAAAAASGAAEEDLRADVRRLLERTEQIQKQLAVPPGGERHRLPFEPDPSSPWVLLGGGLFLGIILGAMYGRRQERQRRTRIRL